MRAGGLIARSAAGGATQPQETQQIPPLLDSSHIQVHFSALNSSISKMELIIQKSPFCSCMVVRIK